MSKKSTLILVGMTIVIVTAFVCTIFLPSFHNTNLNKEVYATEINVTCARSIDLFIENSIYFKELPVMLSPSNCNQEISVNIFDISGTKQDNCKFKDNYFSATETGSYYLTFSVTNKYNQIISDKIKIKVYDETEDCVDCITITSPLVTIYNNENLNLDSIVNIKTSNSSNINYIANNTILSSNNFASNIAGNYDIKVLINNIGFAIIKTFNIEVKERQVNYITLKDKDNNMVKNMQTITVNLSDETTHFYFETSFIGQAITCSMFDDNLISIISKEPPFLVIQLNKIGQTKLRISTTTGEEIIIFINIT